MAEVVPFIRFPLLTLEEFTSVVVPAKILSKSQTIEMFGWLGVPEEYRTNMKMTFNVKERRGGTEKWTFDPQGIWGGVILSDKNMTATISISSRYSVATGSVVWKKGKHAWAFYLNNFSGWMVAGISKKKDFSSLSTYTDPTFWGWSSASQQYGGGGSSTRSTGVSWKGTQTVHMLVDLDKNSLTTLCLESGSRAEYTGCIPVEKDGYLAHFILYSYGTPTVCTMSPIAVKDFGIKKNK